MSSKSVNFAKPRRYPRLSAPRIVCIKCVAVVRVHFWHPDGDELNDGSYRYSVAVECKCGRKFGTIEPFKQTPHGASPTAVAVQRDDLTTKDIADGLYGDLTLEKRIEAAERSIRKEAQLLAAMRWALGKDADGIQIVLIARSKGDEQELAVIDAPAGDGVQVVSHDGEYVMFVERVASMADRASKAPF